MSHDATRWAWAQQCEKGSDKLVLLALAECVNGQGDEMACWPSRSHLVRLTDLDLKTVTASLARLQAGGLIHDSDRRVGATGQVRVWVLHNRPETGAVPSADGGGSSPSIDPASAPLLDGKQPEIGALQSDPVFHIKRPVLPGKATRSSLKSDPKTGHGTGKEPGKEPGKGTRKAPVPVAIDGVDPELVEAWQQVRKVKRAGPINDIVVAGLKREAGLAGITVADAIRVCCERGWQGFNHDWYAKRPATATTGKHSGFASKNYREGVEADGSFH